MSSVLPQAALRVSAVLQAETECWALPNTGLNPSGKKQSTPEVWAFPTEGQELPCMPPALSRTLLNPTVIQQLLSLGKFDKKMVNLTCVPEQGGFLEKSSLPCWCWGRGRAWQPGCNRKRAELAHGSRAPPAHGPAGTAGLALPCSGGSRAAWAVGTNVTHPSKCALQCHLGGCIDGTGISLVTLALEGQQYLCYTCG